MRRWGTVITVSYALIVLGLLVPGAALLVRRGPLLAPYNEWITWVPVGAVIAGEALLLFLSVDTSRKKLKPRAHVLVSALVTAMLFGLLSGAAILCLGFGVYGDDFAAHFLQFYANILAAWGALWLAWTIVFYLYFRNSSAPITRATSWLLKGSVLELLIAVPSHVVVRRRHDCSAPAVTSFGIATGIAIMLLSFGPSVLLLYKKRMDEYANRAAGTGK